MQTVHSWDAALAAIMPGDADGKFCSQSDDHDGHVVNQPHSSIGAAGGPKSLQIVFLIVGSFNINVDVIESDYNIHKALID